MARKPVCLRTWSCFVNVVVVEWWGWAEVVAGEVSVKGFSRWVSCVDRRVSRVDSSVGV